MTAIVKPLDHTQSSSCLISTSAIKAARLRFIVSTYRYNLETLCKTVFGFDTGNISITSENIDLFVRLADRLNNEYAEKYDVSFRVSERVYTESIAKSEYRYSVEIQPECLEVSLEVTLTRDVEPKV